MAHYFIYFNQSMHMTILAEVYLNFGRISGFFLFFSVFFQLFNFSFFLNFAGHVTLSSATGLHQNLFFC